MVEAGAGIAAGFLGAWNSLFTFLFYSWPFILVIGLFVLRSRWSKYPLEAVIIEKRGENLVKTNDRVGRFFDKHAEMSFYRLKQSKDMIPIYNYDWILHNVAVPTNFLERFINLLRGNSGTLFLFRYGSKQYKPINLSPGKTQNRKFVEVKNDKGEPVFSYQYVHFDPRNMMGALDFEVIDWDNMNFMVQEQRASIIRRQKKGDYWKQTLIPLVIIGSAVLVAIFILKFSMDAGRDLRGGATQSVAGTPADGSKIGGAISNVFNPGE